MSSLAPFCFASRGMRGPIEPVARGCRSTDPTHPILLYHPSLAWSRVPTLRTCRGTGMGALGPGRAVDEQRGEEDLPALGAFEMRDSDVGMWDSDLGTCNSGDAADGRIDPRRSEAKQNRGLGTSGEARQEPRARGTSDKYEVRRRRAPPSREARRGGGQGGTSTKKRQGSTPSSMQPGLPYIDFIFFTRLASLPPLLSFSLFLPLSPAISVSFNRFP
ncbi:unnamed protein product [Protopolystoma xenopodis]|uniref:Uncharacterized protein n=1 Tax=Protopolystoma xenopodis TaxID=117903 RepID=A0A448XG90_9PLAT|nr:unnamed protein product [Protopolystoma xenopodis]